MHDDSPHVRIKEQKFPFMDRLCIEEYAYKYLELPYRAPILERTLVDILIGVELYAYTKQMLGKPPVGLNWASRSPLQQRHILLEYLLARFRAALVLLGPAWLAAMFYPGGHNVTSWIIGICVTLYFLELVISTACLPFAWRSQTKARRKVRELMGMMIDTYDDLSGDGLVSTRRLREVAARAADAGVVWPKPLFLILDDNIARTGRL